MTTCSLSVVNVSSLREQTLNITDRLFVLDSPHIDADMQLHFREKSDGQKQSLFKKSKNYRMKQQKGI